MAPTPHFGHVTIFGAVLSCILCSVKASEQQHSLYEETRNIYVIFRLSTESRSVYDKFVAHTCSRECPCRVDLDAAVVSLNESSRALLGSTLCTSDDLIERRLAELKMAWAKVNGAHANYRDHFAEV